jgi:hypothetical protein
MTAAHGAIAGGRLTVTRFAPDVMATATVVVETSGPGFTEITRDAARFVTAAGGRDGVLFLFLRHTSASLVIQENADPDVQTDLVTALARLAPAGAGWVHDTEGPDDMPARATRPTPPSRRTRALGPAAPSTPTWIRHRSPRSIASRAPSTSAASCG